MEWLLLITATVTGLIAGLFFAWSCSVMLGLAKAPDLVFLTAMKSMNRAIQNPLFFSCFFGAALLLPISAFITFSHSHFSSFWVLLAASIIYWAGVMSITILGNVPLNNRLDDFSLQTASSNEMADLRVQFEVRWNRLNHLRTLSSLAAFILALVAVLYS